MKHDEKWGLELIWAGVGLLVLTILLGYLVQSPGASGLEGISYYAVVIALCVIEVAAVYLVVRKFFGKKK